MVRIVEVGPRDGLQNEKIAVSTDLKIGLIEALADSGLKEIEATSFVSPKLVPQLADAFEVVSGLPPETAGRIRLSALVPNLQGLERALQAGLTRVALFTAASDEFTRRNINMTVDESLEVFAAVAAEFRKRAPNGFLRGYVSTAFECPFAGRIPPHRTARVAKILYDDVGVDEISLGDTIGVAVPREVRELHECVALHVPESKVTWHFHDTRGTAIANVAAALDLGYRAFDSSAAGLGGCPFAPGAGGNLSTEDLVYFLERSGIDTGVDLDRLARASLPVLAALGRAPAARAQQAALSGSLPK